MAKKVRIQSSETITVTSGLQHNDVTNPDAHIPDRLKISPTWPKNSVQIRTGVGLYPVEIVEWNTVKALAKDGILTIGEVIDDETTEASSAVPAKFKKTSAKSLEDVAN